MYIITFVQFYSLPRISDIRTQICVRYCKCLCIHPPRFPGCVDFGKAHTIATGIGLCRNLAQPAFMQSAGPGCSQTKPAPTSLVMAPFSVSQHGVSLKRVLHRHPSPHSPWAHSFSPGNDFLLLLASLFLPFPMGNRL